MKHWRKIIISILLATSLIASTGCIGKKVIVIPDDRELLACPLDEGRVSISKGYLREIKQALDACAAN